MGRPIVLDVHDGLVGDFDDAGVLSDDVAGAKPITIGERQRALDDQRADVPVLVDVDVALDCTQCVRAASRRELRRSLVAGDLRSNS